MPKNKIIEPVLVKEATDFLNGYVELWKDENGYYVHQVRTGLMTEYIQSEAEATKQYEMLLHDTQY